MKELRFAVKNTIPIFFTYLFIGIAFGILMSDAGYSVLLTTASSFFIPDAGNIAGAVMYLGLFVLLLI